MLLLLVLNGAFDGVQVLGTELARDGVEVPHGVDRVVHVHNLVGLEATDEVEDAVHGRNVGEEGIPQARPFAGALDQAGNVGDVQVGRDLVPRLVQVAEVVEALVGHGAPGLVGVDGTVFFLGRGEEEGWVVEWADGGKKRTQHGV